MTLVDKYIERLKEVHAIEDMNRIIEEAANDNRLTTEEYQTIYLAGIRMVMDV